MAQTIRRKQVPGFIKLGYHQPLEGEALATRLRLWHGDNSRGWAASPPKQHRQQHEKRHRGQVRVELARWLRNRSHPVQLVSKPKLVDWA